MKYHLRILSSLALAAVSLSAIEKDFVDRLVASAKNIERDAGDVGLALKARTPDEANVKKLIGGMNADVAKLRDLVQQFDSTNPSLSDRDKKDWAATKEKVALLEIFVGQKEKLAGEDLLKHRGLIRTHAAGVVKRAQVLQQSVLKLSRS